MKTYAYLIAILLFVVNAPSVRAAAPDLTNGELPTSGLNLNLGPTGLQGWMYHVSIDTSESRQILVQNVDAGSPADGILAVADVILGADGTGAAPASFSSDARLALAQAITDAEARNPATLQLLRWRAGVTTTVTLTLQTLGSYSATAPFNCPKSAAILENCIENAMNTQDGGWFGTNILPLLAANDPSNPKNAARQARAQTYAHELIESQERLDFWKSGEIDAGSKITWRLGHKLIVLSEYYLQTQDPLVLPTIEAMAVQISNGLSMFGTAGHQLTPLQPDGSPAGPYGWGYGPVNSAGMPCMLALVMAEKCGINRPEVLPAIERANRFLSYYVGSGTTPYGEDAPLANEHTANGRSGLAALHFSLQQDRAEEAKFFSFLSTAGASERDTGHTGPFFNHLWTPLGAQAGGDGAAIAHFESIRKDLELARRWDGAFAYNRIAGDGTGSLIWTRTFWASTYGALTYALPLRQLHITGKGQNPNAWLTSQEVDEAIFANTYDPSTRSTADVIADLGHYSPKVRTQAAAELGNRIGEHATILPIVTAIATDPDGGIARIGAVQALGQIADDSSAPVLAGLLTDPVNRIRYLSAESLRRLSQPAKLGVVNTILAAAAATSRPLLPLDDEDPMHLDNGMIAHLLFYGGQLSSWGVISGNGINAYGIDRDLLYPAIRAVAQTPNGYYRSQLHYIYPYLTKADLEALAGAVVGAVETVAPAQNMFAGTVRDHGVILLQKFGYAEGVPLIINMVRDDSKGATSAISKMADYAGSSTTVTPDPKVEEFLTNFLGNPAYRDQAQAALDAIAADPDPASLQSFKTIFSAGADSPDLTLPNRTTVLRVNAIDLAEGETIYTWRKVHGAGEVSFSTNGTAAAQNAGVAFDGTPGQYEFEVTMSDSRGYTEEYATVSVTLRDAGGNLPANAPPVANTASLSAGRAVVTPLTLTGSDPENLALSFAVISPPEHGTLQGTAPHLTYTSHYDYTGPDSFTFEVMDSEGQTATATVDITVTSGSTPALAVYEPFDYPAGALQGQSGNSEIGFDGSWESDSSTVVLADSISHGSLPATGGKIGYADSFARFGGARAISSTALGANGLLDDGATLWMSALVHLESGTNLANTSFNFALANNRMSSGASILDEGAQAGLGLGFRTDGNGRVYASRFNSPSDPSPLVTGSWANQSYPYTATFVPGATALVVCKFTWATDPAEPDTIEVYKIQDHLVLPSAPVSVLETVVDQSAFDTISFSRKNTPILDEIRLGGSYHSVLVGNAPMSPDATPPGPVAFQVLPKPLGSAAITMTAATAFDPHGVEYYFTCTSGGGNDSGWQSDPSYTDTGLTPGTLYSYTVKTRDLSPARNESAPSAEASATLETSTIIPNLTGVDGTSAEAHLAANHLAPGTITESFSDTIPVGAVISQSPGAGVSAPLGSFVDFVVSVGPEGAVPPTITATNFVDDQSGGVAFTDAPVTYSVTFSKDMDAATLTAEDFSNAGTAPITIGAISEVAPGVFTVIATPTSIGSLQLQIPSGAVIKDVSGFFLDTASAIADDTILTVREAGSGSASVYEPFADSDSTLDGNTPGAGLTGTWSSDQAVASPTLSYGSLPVSGNRVSFSENGQAEISLGTTLSSEGLLADGATLWFSLIWEADGWNSNMQEAFALGTDRLSGSQGMPMSNSGNGIGVFFNKNWGVAASTWSGGGNTIATSVGAGTGASHFIVGRITWGADGASADTVEIFLPGTDLSLPALPASTTTAVLDQSLFDTITFSTKGAGGGLDEIRFGADYDSVIGLGGPEDATPPTLSNGSYRNDADDGAMVENTSVTFTISFGEDIDAASLDASDFGNAGTAPITIDSVVEIAPGVVLVVVTPTGPGTLRLQVNAGATITDSAGNPLDTTTAITDDNEIDVTLPNSAPAFIADPITGADATEDSLYSESIAGSASDADTGDILTYAKVSGPAWLNVAANGDLSGTPTDPDIGLNSFTVSVSDGTAAAVEATLNINVLPTVSFEPLIYEPFADSDSTLTGNTPGTGLTGTWQTSGSTWNVSSPGMTFGTLPTSGNRAVNDPVGTHGIAFGSTLSDAGLLNHGTTLWFSLLWKMDNVAVNNGDAAFALGTDILKGSKNNGMPMNGSGSGIGVSISTAVGNLSAASWSGGSRTTGGSSNWPDRSAPVLVVGKITWGVDGTVNDTVEIYTPSTSLELPAVPVSSISAVLDQSQFDTITFGTKNEGAPQIDEIRFGESYESVIGAGSPSNASPVADDQSVSTNEDTDVAVTLTASDADGDTLTYSVVTAPANGVLSGTAPDLTYTPNTDYNGSDSFTYTANDGTTDSNTATVSITVNPVNDAPVADDQSVSTDEDTAVGITLTANDLDGDTLTYTVVTAPTNGTLSGTAPALTYTPNPDYSGSDSFTFVANDGAVDSNTATVSITVNAVNDAPVFTVDPIDGANATEDSLYSESIAGSATDADTGDTLTYAKVSGPAWLSVAANGDLSGTPSSSDVGVNAFTVSVTDSNSSPVEATLNITVNAAVTGWTTVLSEDFETATAGSAVPPSGWSLITVAGAPSYAVTGAGQGSQGNGTSSGLAAMVTSTSYLGNPWVDLPGGYLVRNTDYDLSGDLRVTYDFQIVHEGSWDDVIFVLGAIDDGVSTSSAGELLSVKFAEQGGTHINTGLGTESSRIAGTSTILADDTWYRATITWTPTAGSTGTLTVAVNDFSGDLVNLESSNYTFDSTIGQIGLGSVNDTIRFDNVIVETFGSGSSNTAPVWASNPINEIDATEGSPYSSTLADDASDSDSDPLTYAKASGPAWLSVATDGTLSGTPGSGDVGANSFIVSVSDGSTAPVNATLNLTINPTPVLYTVSYLGNGNTGGSVPSEQTKEENVALILSGPDTLQRTGYQFTGWNTAADGSGISYTAGASYTENAALTLHAQWIDEMVDLDTPGNAMPLQATHQDWQLVFSDEFNGTEVDANKWNIDNSATSRAPRTDRGINQWFWKPQNVRVENGNLVLDVVKHDSGTMHCGSINSQGLFEPKYGYFETRVEIGDTTKDTHTAFWLQGHEMTSPVVVTGDAHNGAEVDIFESAWFGDYTKAVVHIDGYGADKQNSTKQYSTPGLHDGFNVFGLEWTANSMKIYYNGVHKITYDGTWVPRANEWVWLSNGASFGDIGTFSQEALGLLTQSRFDYVRVWQATANQPPAFVVDSMVRPLAFVDEAYGATVAGAAEDSELDPLTYSKVSGPSWLNVAADGTLSGTPASGDIGTNVWTIQVADGQGGTDLATLEITVQNLGDPRLLVGGALLNGDFNAAPGASVTFASTPVWYNTRGSQTAVATRNDITYDGTQNAILHTGRGYGVQTGHTIASGNVFDFSYVWKDDWQWVGSTEQVKVSLFVTDDNTITGNRTDLVVDNSGIRQVAGAYESVSREHVYTATAADAGKTLFAAIETDSAGFARLDNFVLVVTPFLPPPPLVEVPNVVGLTQSSAESALVAASLIVGTVTETYSSTVQAGDVTSQNPAGGSMVDVESPVDLVVSLGPEPATVPNVVGLAQASAESAIVAANLTVGIVTEAYSDTVPTGNVISQGLNPGASVPQGSEVDLTVSLGIDNSPKLLRTTVSSVSSASWTTVDLGRAYHSPVIIATPIYPSSGLPPVVTRIRNTTSTGFDIKIDRADSLSDPVSIDVSVVVVDEGVYSQATDGVTMEAVKYTSTVTAHNSGWVAENRTYQNSYANPVVLGQVMSANDTGWSVFWSMGSAVGNPADATNLNVGKHVAEDPDTTRSDETIGYIVIESGTGSIGGIAYEAGLGSNTVQGFGNSATPYSYTLSGTLSTASSAAVSQAGMNGTDGSWAVLSGSPAITPSAIGLHACEDQVGDTEQAHIPEQVGYLVFE